MNKEYPLLANKSLHPAPVAAYHPKPDEFEYQLVIQTGLELSRQILETRQMVAEAYSLPGKKPLPAYIKLATFKAKEAMEPTIERWISRICSMQPGFPVMLNNYGGFPTGKLFVRVQHHEPFKQLASSLSVIDDYIKSYGCPSAKIVTHPYVTISNHLPENLYTKVMLDFSARDFNGSFMVEELVLLKRKNRNEEPKKINLFRLAPARALASEAV